MIQPINYLTDIQNPLESALKGYQTGLQIRQQREQLENINQKREQAKTLQNDLLVLSNNPNPKASDFSKLMIKYPELSESFKKNWEIVSESQKEYKLNQLTNVYAALQSDNINVANKILEDQKEAYLNSGLEDEAKKTDIMIKQIEINPKAAKTATQFALASVMGPEKFNETLSKLQQSQTSKYRTLNESEKKDLGLDPSKPYQIGSDGKITSIGGGGVQVNVDTKGKFGTIPPGWVVKEDPKTGGYVMEVIPGGPADQKAKQVAKAKVEQKTLEDRAGNVVIQDIERLKRKIEKAPWYSPVAGAIGEKLVPGLRQNRVDAEQLKETIVANIGFDRLQQMRDASPTGGALGQVSERELSTLQAVLGSLALSQSEDQLIKNLDRLSTLYKTIMKKVEAYPNASEFGFSSAGNVDGSDVSVQVNELETKLGRKLTVEEIEYLRNKGQ